MKGSSVLKVLELSSAERNTDLNTPNLTDLWKAITLALLTWRKDDLLLALDLVALKDPGSGVLDEVAVVRLGDLLEERCHLRLWDGLLFDSLGLLLVGSGGEKSSWDHQAKEELVAVVGCEHQVGDARLVLVLGSAWDNDGVADDGSEAVDLGTELDLDDIAGLELDLGLSLVGLERGVWGDESVWGDGGWVGDT